MERIKEILRSKSLKLTKQRLLIASFLFDGHDKHVTAESLYRELTKSKSNAFRDKLMPKYLFKK